MIEVIDHSKYLMIREMVVMVLWIGNSAKKAVIVFLKWCDCCELRGGHSRDSKLLHVENEPAPLPRRWATSKRTRKSALTVTDNNAKNQLYAMGLMESYVEIAISRYSLDRKKSDFHLPDSTQNIQGNHCCRFISKCWRVIIALEDIQNMRRNATVPSLITNCTNGVRPHATRWPKACLFKVSPMMARWVDRITALNCTYKPDVISYHKHWRVIGNSTRLHCRETIRCEVRVRNITPRCGTHRYHFHNKEEGHQDCDPLAAIV